MPVPQPRISRRIGPGRRVRRGCWRARQRSRKRQSGNVRLSGGRGGHEVLKRDVLRGRLALLVGFACQGE